MRPYAREQGEEMRMKRFIIQNDCIYTIFYICMYTVLVFVLSLPYTMLMHYTYMYDVCVMYVCIICGLNFLCNINKNSKDVLFKYNLFVRTLYVTIATTTTTKFNTNCLNKDVENLL